MDELFRQLLGSEQSDVNMEDVEKLASQLQELGIDPENAESMDDLLKMAEDVVQEGGGEEPLETSDDEEKEGSFQEKVAEADFLGRVQAHAFAEEMQKMGMMGSPDDINGSALEALDELATMKVAELLGIE